MLDNQEFFNQFILNSENIQSRLAPIIRGFDLESIKALINLDIQANHAEEDVFHGSLNYLGSHIEYDRNFKQFKIPYTPICTKVLEDKRSYIKIKKGDITIDLVGDENHFNARRGDSTKTEELRVSLDPKTGMMAIETKQSGFVKESLDAKQMETFQRHCSQK